MEDKKSIKFVKFIKNYQMLELELKILWCYYFIQQKSFDGCKYKQKLNFDFYIPSKNMCIEYDGKLPTV